MPPHLVFFLSTLSFLSGVVYASLGLPIFASLIPAGVVFGALFASKAGIRVAALAAALLAIGSFYYYQDDARYRTALAQVPREGVIQGVIIEEPKHQLAYQSFYLQTDFGKIYVQTNSQPAYAYGDTIKAQGKIEPPPQTNYGRYLAGEKVVGLMRKPTITFLSTGGGNQLFAFLFGIKKRIQASYERLLSPQESALLFGIIFGTDENFSNQFAQNLKVSGLRFITAIDGLHLQIVVMIIFGALLCLLPRRWAFVFAFIFAGFFIALTGFTVSGIRSALMAFIAKLAPEVGRLYAPHTAISAAALVLALINPKVLLFDAGFQLSFLAVISIIYFLPALRSLLHLGKNAGFLSWKESLLITIAVQLATAPVVMTQFQTFSLTSFAGSVLIVPLLPFLIVLGFLLALFSFLLFPVALLFGLLVAPMVEYVVTVIDNFSRFAVLFNPPLGFAGTAAYYAILLFIAYRFYPVSRPAT